MTANGVAAVSTSCLSPSHTTTWQSQSSSKSNLISLPTELHQAIFLHCFEPNMPRASPILRHSLSTEFVYKLSFLHAFWSSTPLSFIVPYGQIPPVYEPGLHVRSLFHPLPVPRTTDADEQRVFQRTVLTYRWCTFSRARRYFSSIMEAVMRDLLLTFDPPFSEQDRQRLEDSTKQLPTRQSTFEATTLGGSHLSLKYFSRLDSALYLTYRGPDSRFSSRHIPNLQVAPTHVWAIPDPYLSGRPSWTNAKIDILQTLCSHVTLRDLQYSPSAFHEGMKNAILQRNEEALLVLIWHADQLALASHRSLNSYPFEPPAELFRLAATVSLLPGESEDSQSDNANKMINFSASVSFFKLLVRAHAESIPRDDRVIRAWATRLRRWQSGTESERAFGQWVLDYETQRTSEYKVEHRWSRKSVRQPLFHNGQNSASRRDDPMLRRFVEINGGKVVSFKHEADEINRPICTDDEQAATSLITKDI